MNLSLSKNELLDLSDLKSRHGFQILKRLIKTREESARETMLRAASDEEFLEAGRRWQVLAVALEDLDYYPQMAEEALKEEKEEEYGR